MELTIIAAVAGFALGFAIAWAVAVSRRGSAASGEGGTAVLERELESSKEENKRLNIALQLASSNAASAEAEKRKTEETLQNQQLTTEILKQQMKDVFTSLANDALRDSKTDFLQLAVENIKALQNEATSELDARKQSVEQLVSPIKVALDNVTKETQELEKNRLKESGKIGQELLQLAQTHEKLQSATSNLVNALKSTKTRGRWGEIALRNLVEMAGMSNLCDFSEQTTVAVQGAENKQRPDMIVNLPGGRQIPVDSKVPLDAFMKAMETSDEEQCLVHLKLHSVHTRNHVKALAKSAYHENVTDADFVVMFIPNDTFLARAAELDPDLIQFGIEQKVMIATPSTLFALLKAISYWDRQHKFTENTQKIQNLAVDLVNRITTFTEYLTDVGIGLSAAVDNYNKGIKSWHSRIFPHIDKIKELGVSAAKELPDMDPLTVLPMQLKDKNSAKDQS